MEKKWMGSIGRLVLLFKFATELWYDTHQNGNRIYKLVGFGWYTSKKFNARLYTITMPYVSIQFAWAGREAH